MTGDPRPLTSIGMHRVLTWPRWALHALRSGEIRAGGDGVRDRSAMLGLRCDTGEADRVRELAREWRADEAAKPDYRWEVRDGE